MLSFWTFLIPWGIWDDELNYSTLRSLKRRNSFQRYQSLFWAKVVYSHEHEDVQMESWDLSDTAGLCRERPFALEHICWAIVVCLKGVVWEHSTFLCSLNKELVSRILRHVCGENTAASCAHQHIHPMHLKHSSYVQRRRLIWIFGWQFGCFERRKIFLETVLQMLICVCHFSCSSTVTPSRRCFETCSIGVVSNFRFKGSCFLGGVFVSSPSACILFSSDLVPSDFYNTIQRHHIDFVVNPNAYYLCCH